MNKNDPQGVIAAIDDALGRAKEKRPQGQVIALGPMVATVQGANGRIYMASYSQGQGVSVGKWVSLQRASRGHWSVVGVSNTVQSGLNPVDRAFDLAPPASLTASVSLPGVVFLTWPTLPQRLLTYEVQRSATGTEADAVSIGMTPAGQFTYSMTGDSYFRVRAITVILNKSSWTPWVQGQAGEWTGVPGTIAPGANIDSIDFINHSDIGDVSNPAASFLRLYALDNEFHVRDSDGDDATLGDFVGPTSGGQTSLGALTSAALSAQVLTAGSARNFIVSAETGTFDVLAQVNGLSNGDLISLIAASGHQIQVLNASVLTYKIYLVGGVDYFLSDSEPLLLYQETTNVLRQWTTSDPRSFHRDANSEFGALSSKTTIVDGDLFVLENSEGGYAKNVVTAADLAAYIISLIP